MTQSEKRLFLIQSLLKGRPEYRQVETPRDSEGQRQLLRGLMNVRPPQAADPDFLRVQDAYLQAETAARGITDLADLTSRGCMCGRGTSPRGSSASPTNRRPRSP